MKKLLAPITIAGLTFTLAAQATPVITTASQTNDTNTLPHTFVPSASDLLNGLAPTASSGTFIQEGAGGTPVLTDGTFTSPITRDADGPFQFSTFATGGNTGGTSVTYTLGAATSIRSIDVFGGWQDGGRDQQSYSIFYMTGVLPFTFLTTVDFNPSDPTGNPQVTRVSITDTTTVLAANVTALRFDFNATENGYAGYSEIDVIAVPEPGAFMALASGMALLLSFRRRSA